MSVRKTLIKPKVPNKATDATYQVTKCLINVSDQYMSVQLLSYRAFLNRYLNAATTLSHDALIILHPRCKSLFLI